MRDMVSLLQSAITAILSQADSSHDEQTEEGYISKVRAAVAKKIGRQSVVPDSEERKLQRQ